jgi:ubiquitin-conjugating enzyme E2 D/E
MANLEDNTAQPDLDHPRSYVVATVLQSNSPIRDQQVCHKRLWREFHNISIDPPITISAGPNSPTDLQSWTAMLMIPAERPTPYAGGMFAIDVQFPIEYPRAPPKLKFATRIFHPNISDAGEISGLRVLNERNWSPVTVLQHVLLNLEALLGDPDLEECAEPSAAVAYVEDRAKYEQMARVWTRRYAMNLRRIIEPVSARDDSDREDFDEKMAGLE